MLVEKLSENDSMIHLLQFSKLTKGKKVKSYEGENSDLASNYKEYLGNEQYHGCD